MPTCSTCNVEIAPNDRTTHVRSEWHIYNLKRVVANLPPIPEEIFRLKKQAFCDPVPQTEKKTYCDACKTLFHNDRSFSAHLKSKKHIRNCELRERSNVASFSPKVTSNDNSATSDNLGNSEEQEILPRALPLGACLFCTKVLHARDGDENRNESAHSLAMRILAHMSDVHNFFVPYPEKLVDPVGLLLELGRIVGEERACVYCGRQFYGRKADSTASSNTRVALNAVRNHMLDKAGHTQLWCGEDDPLRVALLIAESEEQNLDTPPSAALAGGELFSRFYDQSIVAPAFLLPDSEEDIYEVRLPSGTVLGHRSMRSVYQQHLTNPATDVTQINRWALTNSNSPSSEVVPSHIGPLTMTSQPRLSGSDRIANRYSAEAHKVWELAVGVRGNLVNRSRLRRQY